MIWMSKIILDLKKDKVFYVDGLCKILAILLLLYICYRRILFCWSSIEDPIETKDMRLKGPMTMIQTTDSFDHTPLINLKRTLFYNLSLQFDLVLFIVCPVLSMFAVWMFMILLLLLWQSYQTILLKTRSKAPKFGGSFSIVSIIGHGLNGISRKRPQVKKTTFKKDTFKIFFKRPQCTI